MSDITQYQRCNYGNRATVMSCLITVAIWTTISTRPAQAQTYTYTTLYSFLGNPDGQNPAAGLVRDSKGNLYGTTFEGGTSNGGTVFKLTTAGNETILSDFPAGTQAGRPDTSLVLDNAGNLYGTTAAGGNYGQGTVYRLNRTGGLTVLYSFTGVGGDGASPLAGLVRDKVGNLYGTTVYGGAGTCSGGCGTVFKVTASGTETVLHAFTGASGDGASPMAGLVEDTAGNLYGTTWSGGDLSCNNGNGCGIVFEINSAGTETVLHAFTGGSAGQNSQAGLARDASGNLYGTTVWGGDLKCGSSGGPGCGTVFKLTKGRKFTVLHSFRGGTDGSSPAIGLVLDTAGNLYGATSVGGDSGCGTVFEVGASGEETVLYVPNSEANISGALVRDASGNLYGGTYYGGGLSHGSVFELTP
jgi:uncharacterized repeat protein (TIGR03803 family)